MARKKSHPSGKTDLVYKKMLKEVHGFGRMALLIGCGPRLACASVTSCGQSHWNCSKKNISLMPKGMTVFSKLNAGFLWFIMPSLMVFVNSQIALRIYFGEPSRKPGINGGRGFYCLRKTAATEIEKINPLVTEMFLAHTEKGMKKHYTERHFEPLDEAIMEMADVFGLRIAETTQASANIIPTTEQTFCSYMPFASV